MLTRPNRENGEADHWWPEFLPGGQAVIFTIWPLTGAQDNTQVAVLDLRTGTYKVVVRGGSHGRYVPTGHLVYGAGGSLRAVAFDLGRLEPLGPPVPVLEHVVTTATGGVDAAFAGNGTMVYVPGGGVRAQRSLVWVDRKGGEEVLPAPPRAYVYPRISPDGTRVALDARDQENDIWIWTFGQQTLTRLTIDPELDQQPAWTPDSRRVVFASTRGGGVQKLFWQPADGTGGVERVVESANQQQSPSVSPDGTRLVFRETLAATGQDLMVMALPPLGPQPDSGAAGGRPDISGQPRPLVQTRFAEPNAEISPDGRWFAYESNQSGRFEIYVRPFPNSDSGLWQVSSGGGRQPLWARNGRELFFTASDGVLMGVRLEPGPTWSSTTPARVLQRSYYDGSDLGGTTPPRTFDIAPDGRRFLKEGGDDASSVQNLVVVQNWDQELTRLVPAN